MVNQEREDKSGRFIKNSYVLMNSLPHIDFPCTENQCAVRNDEISVHGMVDLIKNDIDYDTFVAYAVRL